MTGRYKAYPEYKDSGVEWLEGVPSHWSSKALKFLCTYNDDVINETTDPETIIEYVDIGSVSAVEGISKTEKVAFGQSPSRARRMVRDGDVIVSTVRTYLEAIAPIKKPPENMIVSTGFAVIRPNSELDKGFAAYCLRAKGFIGEVVARSVGISYPAINATELVGIRVPYLPYEEQQKIANFLDHETAKIDSLIAKQEKLIELLKEKRQAVISHAVTKGLNPDAPMKDSGVEWLGEVPEHWVVAQLKFNTKLMQTGPFGSQLHAEDYVEGGVPLINPAHMINGEIVPDPQVSVDADTQDRLSRHKLAEGDIIFARRGELGRCAVVTDQQVGWICGTGSLKATLNERLIPEYAYLLITSDGVVAELSLESKGSTMDNLNTETLGKIRTPVPPVHEQRAILAYVDEVSGKYKHLVDLAENAIGLMKERKTALISAAVTGKIDVRHFVVEQGQPQGVQDE
ncbi:restriction endonuclease subunit S [Vibrio vulnificus]|uniref:restriction endonuclease subunit S n=2 Tax=Vibrio cholerae TaxID=666 RepID=UPI0011F2B635|nr:restriction endonuclease subunit S [Vibrio cholerae]EGR0791148.1 restriction endonuclease subunit S [Vibrio vulnificus]EGR0799775.1 restriction endonuclease subunit S [Vibrio vulnificus]EGR0817198.1 restriction endonuclease subunit S [Vibrio vulnificus]EGR0880010.1 restriction endonuclease subunit S [Vibrio vulnificus]EGR4218096.1 restriction endonuclease subunit S [Vibrio cholerae]